MKNQIEKLHDATLAKVKAKQRVPLLRIIRMKCADCVCWQESEIKACEIDDCILWDFRMGKNPVPKVMSEKQREALRKARVARQPSQLQGK